MQLEYKLVRDRAGEGGRSGEREKGDRRMERGEIEGGVRMRERGGE